MVRRWATICRIADGGLTTGVPTTTPTSGPVLSLPALLVHNERAPAERTFSMLRPGVLCRMQGSTAFNVHLQFAPREEHPTTRATMRSGCIRFSAPANLALS